MWDFERVLAWLREVAHPCAPPIGVGEFEVLYASGVEVVVWYSPAREGHRAGEVAIPCRRLAAAWEALRAGRALDEAALTELGEGMGGGRWLLAVLALVPGMRVEAGVLSIEVLSPQPSTRARRKGARAARAGRTRGARAVADSEDGGTRRGTGTRDQGQHITTAAPQAEGEQRAERDGDRARRARGGAADKRATKAMAAKAARARGARG